MGVMEKRYDFMWMSPLEKHFLAYHATYEAWLAQRVSRENSLLFVHQTRAGTV